MASTADEPLVNLLVSFAGGQWRVVLFPRRKHRPDVYFKEDDERVLVSPATIDIGGLVVAPVERDFNGVDGQTIQSIYNEVMLDQETVEEIVNSL